MILRGQGQVRDADGNSHTDPATGEPMREGGYKDFYDPFVEDVRLIQHCADIRREGDIAKIGARARAMWALGAFGGSRQAIAGAGTA